MVANTEPMQHARGSRRSAWLLVLLVVAVYWPALSGGIVFDDQLNFQGNATLRDGDLWSLCTRPFFRLHLPYWRPVASIVMALGFRTAGLLGVHVLSLVVHAAAAIVAQRFARRVFGDARAAFAAAALFVLHPVQVESVAWASALAEPLCALLTLLAIDAALTWRDGERRSPPWRMAGGVLLALLTKENGLMAVPMIVLVVGCLPGPRVRWRPLLVTIATVLVAWIVMRAAVLERPFGGAGSAGAFDPLSWAAGFAAMMWRSVLLLLVPFPLLPFHTLADASNPSRLGDLASLGVFVGLGVVAAVIWQRRAGPLRVAVALQLVPMLLPALEHYALGPHPLAERYLYLPALGWAFAVVTCLRRRTALLVLLGAVYAFVSFGQCQIWHDQDHFVAHCVQREPYDATVQILAGDLQLAKAQGGDAAALDAARTAYCAASNRLLGLTDAESRQAQANARIGLTWCDLLEQQSAAHIDAAALIRGFAEAIACDDTVAAAWVGLGVVHAMTRNYDAAYQALHHALDLDGQCPEAWFNLGNLQFERQQYPAARRSLEQALRCKPGMTAAVDLLARMR